VDQTQLSSQVTATIYFRGVKDYADALDAIDLTDYLWRRVNGLSEPRTYLNARGFGGGSSGSERVAAMMLMPPQLHLIRLTFESPLAETLRAVGEDALPFLVVLALLRSPARLGSYLGELRASWHAGQDRGDQEKWRRRLNSQRREELAAVMEELDEAAAWRAAELRPDVEVLESGQADDAALAEPDLLLERSLQRHRHQAETHPLD
jgi:hypothetical protein